MLLCLVFLLHCKVMFLFCLSIIQPWFYHVVKYFFNAIIIVNSVAASWNICYNVLSWHAIKNMVFFSCDQTALWMVQSVRPPVCLSVTPFWLCSHHHIITKYSGVISNDIGDVHAKGQGHRSKVKVTEVITQLNRFWTVTPVWIDIWWWNDA